MLASHTLTECQQNALDILGLKLLTQYAPSFLHRLHHTDRLTGNPRV